MLDRFYVGGEDFFWQFFEPAQTGELGYARYCFSYLSKEPESLGQLIASEGMAVFRLRDGSLIVHSAEAPRPGREAFKQLGYETGAGAQAARPVRCGGCARDRRIRAHVEARGAR